MKTEQASRQQIKFWTVERLRVE